MKLKLSELKPNPFKKEINKGRLDEDTINKIQANIKELGLMGALPVFKKDNQYYLIAGHHRVEALKRTFGKNYEISIDLKDYSEDQILRGMVVENLTQRNNEYREEEANILTIKDYLRKNKILLDDNGLACPPVGHAGQNVQKGVKDFQPEYGSIRQISLWLDKDSGDVMKRSKIGDLISVSEKLDPELRDRIRKTGGGRVAENIVGVKQAAEIVRVTQDPEEQKTLWEAMKREEEGRPHELLSSYKNAPEEIKEKVRKGEIKLSEVKIESEAEKNKQAYEEAVKSKDNEIKIIRSGEILQNVREEIIKTTRELDRFFYKVKAVRFSKLTWSNQKEQKSFRVFVDDALKKANLWVSVLEKIKSEVDYER